MSRFAISAIDDDKLESFRSITDPVADNTVSRIITSGDEQKVNEVMSMLFRNQSFHKGMFEPLGTELSHILDDYIEATGQLPEWAEPSRIRNGERLFALYGPAVFMLLNVSSLPMCYTCAKGARVLFETGRLLSHNGNIDPLARRLMETAQMVVNVLSEGGLSSSGDGVVTLQKVRLIHASIRYYLKAGQYQDTKWDVKKYGEPINQEDLAGTLISFGPVIIAGLKRLNTNLSEDQINDYMHCWKVVGHLMGIDERLLPDSYSDGLELATKILKHQAEASDAGKALTQSCIEFMKALIPGNAFDEVPEYFISYFLEDFSQSAQKDLSECIGISGKSDKKDRIIVSIARFVSGELSQLERHKLVQKISASFNKKLLQGIIHHYNDGKGVQFFIPPSLQEDWGLNDDWENKISTPAILGNRISWQQKSKPNHT